MGPSLSAPVLGACSQQNSLNVSNTEPGHHAMRWVDGSKAQDPSARHTQTIMTTLYEGNYLFFRIRFEDGNCHLSGFGRFFAMPDSVILNPGPLDNGELETMQRHALLSVRIMERMEFLEQEIPAVRYHHERFDGKGYPEGLKGAAIPLTARILAVADSFDAMTSPRTFRPAKTQTEALAELRRSSGLQFDPTIVDTFICAALRLGERLTACPDKGVDLADEALPSEHTASEIPVEG